MPRTEIIRIHPARPKSSIMEEAAKLIRKGGLVVYPTESAYGLGCNALDERSLKRVFEVKRRPSGAPLPILVSDLDMLRKYALMDRRAETLMKAFWPGPLTIALNKKTSIPDILNPRAVAARISGHPVAASLVVRAGVPIAATSANTSGKPAHYSVKQVANDIGGKVDLILDAGKLPRRKPSTIVDFTLGATPKITRVGALPVDAISKIIRVEVVVK